MKVSVCLTVLLCCLLGVKSTIVIPDEVPSLLSVIYSNIPTLKKGTDSRFGWGFRLGDRADVQFLVELGPQTYTQKLANQQDKEKSSEKRNTLETLADKLYAQNQDIKKLKEEQKEEKKHSQKKPIHPETKPNIDASEWLRSWSSSVKQDHKAIHLIKPQPGLGIGEIDAKSVLPEDDDVGVDKMKVEISENSGVSTMKPISSTSKEDALDNVDLD